MILQMVQRNYEYCEKRYIYYRQAQSRIETFKCLNLYELWTKLLYVLFCFMALAVFRNLKKWLKSCVNESQVCPATDEILQQL